jgi:hypothetical protein
VAEEVEGGEHDEAVVEAVATAARAVAAEEEELALRTSLYPPAAPTAPKAAATRDSAPGTTVAS